MFKLKSFILFLFLYVSSGREELLQTVEKVIEQFLQKNNININFSEEELKDISNNKEKIKVITQSTISDYTSEISEASRANCIKQRLKNSSMSDNNFLNLLGNFFVRKKNLIQIRKEYDLYKKIEILNKQADKDLAIRKGLEDKEKIISEFEALNACKDKDCSIDSIECFYANYSGKNKNSTSNDSNIYSSYYNTSSNPYKNSSYYNTSSNPYKNSSYYTSSNFYNTYSSYFNPYYTAENGDFFYKSDIEYLFGISKGPVSINSDDYLTKDDDGLYVYTKNDKSKKYRVSLKSLKFLKLNKYIIIGHYKKDLNDVFIVNSLSRSVACYQIGSLKSNSNFGFYVSMEKTNYQYSAYYFDGSFFYNIYFNDWSELNSYRDSFNFEKKYLDIINEAYEKKLKKQNERNKGYNYYYDDTPNYTSYTPNYTSYTPNYASYTPNYTSYTPNYASYTPNYTSYTPNYMNLDNSNEKYKNRKVENFIVGVFTIGIIIVLIYYYMISDVSEKKDDEIIMN